MGWFEKAAGWIVAVVVTVAAAVLAYWYQIVLRDRAKAANARANGAETILVPEIKKKQKKLDDLAVATDVETIAVKEARDELNAAKKKLAGKFQSQGLSADEIVARFERRGLGLPGGYPAVDADPG